VTKISDLTTELTAPTGNERLAATDDPTGTPSSQWIDLDGVVSYVASSGSASVAHGAMGASVTFDASASTHHSGDIDANVTIDVSNLSHINSGVICFLTESGGSHTITWTWAVNTPGTHDGTDTNVALFTVSWTPDGPYVQYVGEW